MSAETMALEATERPVPRLGGFKAAIVGIEVRRLLRNRRTVIFTVIVPVPFFLLFGLNAAYATNRVGKGNESAFIMISMALYGAVLATSSGGAMVSVECLLGWSRQLRITPLSPAAYISTKMATSLVLGLAAVVSRSTPWASSPTSRRCPRICRWRPQPRCRSARCCSPRSGCSSATCFRRRT